MEQRTILSFLIFSLFVPCAEAATRPHQSVQHELAGTPQGTPAATVSTHPQDADSLLVPDGTPLLIKVVNEFSSSDAKVGDVIDFVVVFAVRADGITVIPKGTTFTAKVVSVSRARRGARGGRVKVAFEKFSLPTGEAGSVRSPQNKANDAAKGTAEASGIAAGLFITAGVPLFALPFEKGDDQFVPAGATQVVSLNGTLRVSRKAAMQVQPAPSSAYAYIEPRLRDRMLWCGQTSLVIYGSNEFLEMKLNPGTYWFSTERQKDQPARIDVVEGRKYYVVQDRHGLTVRESQTNKNFLVSGLVLDEWDLTNLAPEESRSLVAQPGGKKNHSPAQKH
jgi:hypothetical protein